MANDIPIDHGMANKLLKNSTLAESNTTFTMGNGQFTPDADKSTTILDPNIPAGARIVLFPSNGTGGLLLRSVSCFASVLTDGIAVFSISATAAGLPAGTEALDYIWIKNS